MTQPTATARLSITMSVAPSERLVTAFSGLVSEFCQVVLEDLDAVSRFHMAAHELAENVAKYSTGRNVSIEVRLEETSTAPVMHIKARNQANPEQLREVEQRLAELTTAADPIELYDRLIRETAPIAEGSGLGLARIRAEGELDVDYAVDGDELTISVHAPVELRKGKTGC